MGRMLDAFKQRESAPVKADKGAGHEQFIVEDSLEKDLRTRDPQGSGKRRQDWPGAELLNEDDRDSVYSNQGSASHDGDEPEMPFIEVGAGIKLDGSPQVMKIPSPTPRTPSPHGGQPAYQPPHHQAAASQQSPATHHSTPHKDSGQPANRREANAAPGLTYTAPVLAAPSIAMSQPSALSFTLEPWPALNRATQGLAAEIIAYHQPEHPISKQYAELMESMISGTREAAMGSAPVMLLVGSQRQVGTSTVLLNLAAAGCVAGEKRICVVDMNLQHPGLAPRLGHTAPVGIQDVLQGKLALEQALLQTAAANLHLLPAQRRAPSFELTAEALHWLFSWLKPRYDAILVDGPSMDEPADLALLAPSCDAAFLVFAQGAIPHQQRHLAHSLASLGGRLRGLLHTHWDLEQAA